MRRNFVKQDCSGISIIEIVIALGIFSVMLIAIASLLLNSVSMLSRSDDIRLASSLARTAGEALEMIGERAWNELRYETSGLSDERGFYELKGEGTHDEFGGFIRYMYFEPVYRDNNGSIVNETADGATIDPLSKKVRISVVWTLANGNTRALDNWRLVGDWSAKNWEQDVWTGGPGQEILIAADSYYEDSGSLDRDINGDLVLMEIATSTYAVNGWLTSSAYRAENGVNYSALTWEEAIPGNCPACAVKILISSAEDNEGVPGIWSEWCGPDGVDGDNDDYFNTEGDKTISIDHNSEPWLKYRLELSGETDKSPIFKRIKVYYH